ncbi:MAG: hypothetical protein ACRC1L_07785 [Prochlorococcaceae cyanobacterium]
MSSPAVARLGRFSINALRIGASPAAVVELLRQHWISAACFSAAVAQGTDRPNPLC